MKIDIINIPSIISSKNGQLCFFESERTIPFAIKRIYYITNVLKDQTRGAHAHKKLQQLLFCPFGSVTILLNDGVSQQVTILDKPDIGLVISPPVWRDLIWNIDNSVLCVAVSDYYDEDDYIRDYETFQRYIEEEKK